MKLNTCSTVSAFLQRWLRMVQTSTYGVDPVSVFGTGTRYGLMVRGLNLSGGARFSAPVQTGLVTHPASYTIGTRSFPGVKRPGVALSTHPPRSAKNQRHEPFWAIKYQDMSRGSRFFYEYLKHNTLFVLFVCVCVCAPVWETERGWGLTVSSTLNLIWFFLNSYFCWELSCTFIFSPFSNTNI